MARNPKGGDLVAADRLTGEAIEELKTQASTHFWPHSRMAGDMTDETGVKLVTSAEGVWVEDVEGRRWLDVMAGMWLKNIGHGRREIADAVYEQMQDVSYTPGGTVSPATVKLAAKVASLAPDKESRVYFVSGGSEAVESALKMAKQYHKNNGESGRWKVISRSGSYHGATFACMSLGGGGVAVPENFGPLMPGNVHVAQPNPYRCAYCADRGAATSNALATWTAPSSTRARQPSPPSSGSRYPRRREYTCRIPSTGRPSARSATGTA